MFKNGLIILLLVATYGQVLNVLHEVGIPVDKIVGHVVSSVQRAASYDLRDATVAGIGMLPLLFAGWKLRSTLRRRAKKDEEILKILLSAAVRKAYETNKSEGYVEFKSGKVQDWVNRNRPELGRVDPRHTPLLAKELKKLGYNYRYYPNTQTLQLESLKK